MNTMLINELSVGQHFSFPAPPHVSLSHYIVVEFVDDGTFVGTNDVLIESVNTGIKYVVSGNREVYPISMEIKKTPKIKKEKKMTKVIWKNEAVKTLKFDDLKLNDSFKICTKKSKGAVYTKVRTPSYKGHEFYMLEVATGKLFEPTVSTVEKVEVTVNVEALKPEIY